MNRILSIQDISCVGKCSLTVALPIISAMGVEAAIIPTAVLSTHTMFESYTCKDLDDQILPITEKWMNLGINFDAIYTGYLANAYQTELVKEVFERFPNNIKIIDPVMGDNGKSYPAFDKTFNEKMMVLCKEADYILPNITEGSFMTGLPYKEQYDEDYIKEMLRRLSLVCNGVSILTGVGFSVDKTGAYGYDAKKNEFYYYETDRIGTVFHGTGDIFASTFTGAMMRGFDWKESIGVAADYTAKCIEANLEAGEKGCTYGVNFEAEIPYLLKRIGAI